MTLVDASALPPELDAAAREALAPHWNELQRRLRQHLDDWVAVGLREFGHSADALQAYFGLEALRAHQVLRRLERGVHLEDRRACFELVCEAMLGHAVEIEELDEEVGRWQPPRSDAHRLLVPRQVNALDDRADNARLLRCLVLHQVGLHLEGTFTFGLHAATSGTPGAGGFADFYAAFPRPAVARRLFALVEHRRVDAALSRRWVGYRSDLETLRPQLRPAGNSLPALLSTLSLGLEPQAHGSPLALELRGLFAQLDAADTAVERAATVTTAVYALLEAHDLLDDALALRDAGAPRDDAHTTANQEGPAETSAPDLPAEIGSQRDELGDLLHGELDGEAVQAQLEALAEAQVLDSLEAEHSQRQQTEGGTNQVLQPDGLGVLSIQDGDLSNAAGLFLHDLSFLDGEHDQPNDLTELRDLVADLSDEELRDALDEARRSAPVEATGAEFLYDEWDHLIGDYRRNWCRLAECEPRPSRPEKVDKAKRFVARTLDRHRPLRQQIRRQFEMLKPELYQRLRGLTDGEELEFDRLVAAAVDRRSGVTPDDRIYSRRHRQERSVAAGFLVDLSASTDTEVDCPEDWLDEDESQTIGSTGGGFDARFDIGPDAEPSDGASKPRDPLWLWPPPVELPPPKGRRVVDIQKEAIVLMAEALQELGDQYAIWGFSGYGRERNDFYVAKEFDQTYDRAVRERIGALEPKQSTRMGPAIRHAVQKLEQTDAKIRALLILSDGYPQDCDYGPMRGDRTYGMHDTTRALREAAQRGIHTFCITVDPAGHDYLREMCPERSYLVIDEVAALPAELPKVYRGITR